MAETASPKSGRIEGIDVARGLASAIMVQGHAYDGWVADEHKTSAAYLFTRVLGSLPLPSFLVLAGAALYLRVEAAIRKNERAGSVRLALVKRGLFVVLVGYVVNAVSALMDGWEGVETFTRADVLQLIGLSIVTLGGLGVRADAAGRIDGAHLRRVALALAILPVVLSPVLTPLAHGVTGPARHVLGLFLSVPDVSRMPFVPLAGWAGFGVLVAHGLSLSNREARSIAGAPDRVLLAVTAVALVVVLVFTRLTTWLAEVVPGTVDGSHVAVIPNAIELAARAVIVLCAGALLTTRLPNAARAVLVRLGRGSLVAYVFHVPFSYGALGEPVRGRLDMWEATALVVVLEVASYLAVLLRDTVRDRLAAGGASTQEARG